MTATRNFIPNDGYNLKGFVDARAGINEAVRFVYRPVTAEQQSAYNAALALLTDTATNPSNFRKRAAILQARLVSWDVTGNDGSAVEITPQNVRQLAPELFWRLFGIVFGTMPSDVDPQWSQEEANEEADVIMQAALEGCGPSLVRQEADEKNLD